MFFRLLKNLFAKREQSATTPGGKRDDQGDLVKPFLEHLEDLRWTAIKMAITLFIAMSACFVFAHQLFAFLEQPLVWAGLNPRDVLRSNTVVGPIMSAISLSFYCGITLSFPILMYFLGEFVLPALHEREKKAVLPAVFIGFLLFLGGVAFAFVKILPGMIQWLAGYAEKSGFQVLYDVKDYFGFVAHLCIAFGLLCELPVVVVTLNVIGVVTHKWLASTRAYAFTAVLVLCAIISPTPDIATLFVLAFPIMALYEICIWVTWWLDKRRAARDAEEARRGELSVSDEHEPID